LETKRKSNNNTNMADEERDATTNDVINMLMSEGDVTTLPVEQDEEGNIVSIDKTNFEKKLSDLKLSELANQESAAADPSSALPPLSVLEIDDASVLKIAPKFATGVKSSDIKTTKMFKQSFVGRTAVDWLVQNTCPILGKEKEASCSRAVALEVGKRLLEKKLIWISEGQKVKNEFSDDSTIYQHLHSSLLFFDPISNDIAAFFKEKLKTQPGGITLKDEKVLMKKFKNVFTEPELEKWISENVRGLGEQDPSKIVKNLFKKKYH